MSSDAVIMISIFWWEQGNAWVPFSVFLLWINGGVPAMTHDCRGHRLWGWCSMNLSTIQPGQCSTWWPWVIDWILKGVFCVNLHEFVVPCPHLVMQWQWYRNFNEGTFCARDLTYISSFNTYHNLRCKHNFVLLLQLWWPTRMEGMEPAGESHQSLG